LLCVFAQAGVTRTAGPGNKLSHDQVDAILAGRSVSDRIALKVQIERAGLYPVAD
jgi:hypothetical protein